VELDADLDTSTLSSSLDCVAFAAAFAFAAEVARTCSSA